MHVEDSSLVSVRVLFVRTLALRVVVVFFLLFLVSCFSFPGGISRTGHVETATLATNLSGLVTIYGPFDIVLVPGSKLQANMPRQIIEAVVIAQAPGVTTISAKQGLLLSGRGTVQFLVGIDALSKIEILTSESLSSESVVTKSALSLVLGGVVRGSLRLDIGMLNLEVTTPKLVTLSGKVKKLDLTVTDLAQLNLRRLNMVDEPNITKPIHGSRIKL